MSQQSQARDLTTFAKLREISREANRVRAVQVEQNLVINRAKIQLSDDEKLGRSLADDLFELEAELTEIVKGL